MNPTKPVHCDGFFNARNWANPFLLYLEVSAMSFKQRQIDIQFTYKDGSGVDKTLALKGYRCHCEVIGDNADATGLAHVQIYGMSIAHMNALTDVGTDQIANAQNTMTITAGNAGEPLDQVFYGNVTSSYIDFTGSPEVYLCVIGAPVMAYQAAPAAGNSFKGAVSVAEAIESLAAQMGYAFTNHDVTTRINNQHLDGSIVQQIQTLAHAGTCTVTFDHKTVTITPNGGSTKDQVIELSPETGLIGYPTAIQSSYACTCEFNPRLRNLGRVHLSGSVIDRANGEWSICLIKHSLSTLTNKGPWFSTFQFIPNNATTISSF